MRRKQTLLRGMLVGFLFATVPAGAEIATIDDVPAATLLLPYFEVDLGNLNGINTLFSINNASAAAAIAHVTLWTDQSIPTLDFDVYLTGYDIQTISVRDIFNGNLPRTADRGADAAADANSPSPPLGATQAANVNPFTGPFTPGVPTEFDFGGSSGPCLAPYTNPVLDNFRVTNLRAAHTGVNAPAYGGCLGANYGDNIARGYITVDSVTQCNLLFPSSATYFSGGIADNRNILWGDYVYLEPEESFAQARRWYISRRATRLRSTSPTRLFSSVSWAMADAVPQSSLGLRGVRSLQGSTPFTAVMRASPARISVSRWQRISRPGSSTAVSSRAVRS